MRTYLIFEFILLLTVLSCNNAEEKEPDLEGIDSVSHHQAFEPFSGYYGAYGCKETCEEVYTIALETDTVRLRFQGSIKASFPVDIEQLLEATDSEDSVDFDEATNSAFAFGKWYGDEDMLFAVESEFPALFFCPGPAVRPPPVRRTRRPPRRRRSPKRPKEEFEEDKREPWELEMWELLHRARLRQEAEQKQRQLDQLEGMDAVIAPWFTDMTIEEWRRLHPGDKLYTSRYGCTVEHIARWEEGGTNPTQDWQKYQTNVTGQTGAYIVRTPARQKVSFDGIRVMGNAIKVGIEAKGNVDPTKDKKKMLDWLQQAKRQVDVAKECGFRTVWVIGVKRAFRTMQMKLFQVGVNEVYYSPIAKGGGGELYEKLLAKELRKSMGPGIRPPR